ncbi:MAG: hypothetical protein ETSY2_09465 [Candidatus Entotheonella gemina]|uniref:Adenylate cyclase n=2 Tax=Candidatus Entotheonella TaxID=93171 RepID=W4MC07_9BACT|nr:MAG: hypothetical protein ETSY2_09465 [Candidatus Entotheonella gemina]
MTQPTDSRAILFADISGSTRLFETQGDELALKQVAQCMSLLAEITDKHRGAVIKTTGDGVLSTFASAEVAVQAAVAMQEALTAQPKGVLPQLAIKIGLHFGAVIPESRDIYGDAVNVAARFMDLAKPGQIIATKDIAERLILSGFISLRHLGQTPVKGKQAEMDMYEVIWQEVDLTEMPKATISVAVPQARLRLHVGNTALELSPEQPEATIGRGLANTLVLRDQLASRQHARIACDRGKFILFDQSTNGTYVSMDNGDEFLLKRDQLQLQGSGTIVFGRSGRDPLAEVMQFTVLSEL